MNVNEPNLKKKVEYKSIVILFTKIETLKRINYSAVFDECLFLWPSIGNAGRSLKCKTISGTSSLKPKWKTGCLKIVTKKEIIIWKVLI